MADTKPSEDKIDESLEESFPASDPPSWTVFARIGAPRRKSEISATSKFERLRNLSGRAKSNVPQVVTVGIPQRTS
jgi:hypothetical protein